MKRYWGGFTVLIGISIIPIFPDGSVAMCVVILVIKTKHYSWEFLDHTAMKEKGPFSFNRKWIWGLPSKICSMLSVFSKNVLYISDEKKIKKRTMLCL